MGVLNAGVAEPRTPQGGFKSPGPERARNRSSDHGRGDMPRWALDRGAGQERMLRAGPGVAARRRVTSRVTDNANIERTVRSGGLAAAALTMAGGVVGVVADIADLPLWLGLAGLALFVVGTMLAVSVAFRVARRNGTTVVRALARALKTGFKWLWYYMP